MGIAEQVSEGIVCRFDPYGVVQTSPIWLAIIAESQRTPEQIRTLGRKLMRERDSLPAVLRDDKMKHEISLKVGRLVRILYHGKTVEQRIAAAEALSHDMEDQRALHHAIFHDKDLKVRVAAAEFFRDDDADPLPCESEDEEVRLAFVKNTRWVDMLVAMAVKDPSMAVRHAADHARLDPSRKNALEHHKLGDERLKRYYCKHGP